MPLTKGQQQDLESILFFIPDAMKHVAISDQDIKDFFELSEKGKHQERIGSYSMDGFNALVQGKRWRGIHMEMWEEGILSCDVPYLNIIEGLPIGAVEFAAKELFKGKDKETILKVWKESTCV